MDSFHFFLNLPNEIQLHILDLLPLSVVITLLKIPSLVPLVLLRIPNDKLTIKAGKDLSFDDVQRLMGFNLNNDHFDNNNQKNNLNDCIFYNSYPFKVLNEYCRCNQLKPIDTLEISFNKDLDNSSPPLENEIHSFWHDFNKWKTSFNKFKWSIPIDNKSINFPNDKLQLLKEISCQRSYVSLSGFSIDHANFLHDASSIHIDKNYISHSLNVDDPMFDILNNFNLVKNLIWNEKTSMINSVNSLKIKSDKSYELDFNYHHGFEFFQLLDKFTNLTELYTSLQVDLNNFKNLKTLTLNHYKMNSQIYIFPELSHLSSLTLLDSKFKTLDLSYLINLQYLNIDSDSSVESLLNLSNKIETLKLESHFPTCIRGFNNELIKHIQLPNLTNLSMSIFGEYNVFSPNQLSNFNKLTRLSILLHNSNLESLDEFIIKDISSLRLVYPKGSISSIPDFSKSLYNNINNLEIEYGMINNGNLPLNLNRLKLSNVVFEKSLQITPNLRSLILNDCSYPPDFTLVSQNSYNFQELIIHSVSQGVPLKMLENIKNLKILRCFVDTPTHSRGSSRNDRGRGSVPKSLAYSDERFALITNKTSMFYKICGGLERSTRGFDYFQFKTDCSALDAFSLTPEDVYLVKLNNHLKILNDKLGSLELPELYEVLIPDDRSI